jgi:polyisoprenoid-binding protein YceI
MRWAIWLVASGALWAQPVELHFGPAPGASLTLTVEKTGVWSGRKHVFEFQRYTAKALFNAKDPSKSSVELSIDAASAECHDAWVNDKDREKVLEYMRRDMLDVEHHPQLLFRSERVTTTDGGEFAIQGQLSVRGIEKPVVVTAKVESRDGAVSAVSGTAVVRMKDYGLTPPKAALGAIGTKNEMTVSFRLIPTAATHSN